VPVARCAWWIGGGFLGSVVLLKSSGSRRDCFLYILTLFLPYTLPVTTLTGAIIGATVWWIHKRTRRNIGVVVRAIIGTSLAGILGGLIAFIYAYTVYLSYDDIQRSIVGGIPYSMLLAKYGVIVGAVAGVIVGNQNVANELPAEG